MLPCPDQALAMLEITGSKLIKMSNYSFEPQPISESVIAFNYGQLVLGQVGRPWQRTLKL